MSSIQSQQGGGGQSTAQGSPQHPQASYPFFLPINQLAGMTNFGQPQSGSVLDSSAAASALSSLPMQYSMAQLPFSTVAQSPSSARYSSAPLLHSPTPAVTAQAANTAASLLQQQQFLNELSMQFRMPLAQQQHNIQQAMQAAQQLQQHQQQQQHQQHQQQILSSLAQSIPVSATPLDPRMSPTLASTTTPITATATIRSSQPLHNSISHKTHHKADKRKTTSQEATASLRRKKHKEVEIKRRKKINSLFLQLTNELECGPTDKASVLLYALNFIKGVKKKYAGVEMKTLTGVAGIGEEDRRERDEYEDGDEDEDEDEEEGMESGREEKKVKKEPIGDRKTSDNSVQSNNNSPTSASSSSSLASSAALSQPSPTLTIDPTTSNNTPSVSSGEESMPHISIEQPGS